jgi:hypothetical protein
MGNEIPASGGKEMASKITQINKKTIISDGWDGAICICWLVASQAVAHAISTPIKPKLHHE